MRDTSGFASFAHVRVRGGYELLGPIVRLQVQTAPLKRGEKPHRWYDPAPIRALRRIRLGDGGVMGIDDETGEPIGDVHHRDHPRSRYRGENALSLGFTSHYDLMRGKFGGHLSDGIAGESILVACDRRIEPDQLRNGVVVMTAAGPVAIENVQVAAPCVEFSKFALGYPPGTQADRRVSEAVTVLHQGVRGYYGTLGEAPVDAVISLGDAIYRRE